MGRKIFVGLLLVLLLAGAGFLYLKYGALKAKDFKADSAKARSPLDLRPALIAKLQQLVKDGSDSLYALSIDTLDPDVVASTLDVKGLRLEVDSAGYRRLARLKRLPDDVYRISFAALHVDGVGLEDLLHLKDIKVSGIRFTRPHIEAWEKEQLYNAAERAANKHRTLYQRLTKDVSSISIDSISLLDATYVAHDVARKDKVTTLNHISIRLGDVLVDSATQYTADRVFFAKRASLACRDYSIITPDSLYVFKIGSLAVSGETRTLIANDISLEPRGGRRTFERSIRTRQELYTLSIPRITMTGADWMMLVHSQSCVAKSVAIDGGKLGVYLDKSLPSSPGMKIDNFPQQMLMDVAIPIALDELRIRNLDVVYEEYNPDAKKSGVVTVNRISGHGENVTNMPGRIARQPTMPFTGTAYFMNSTPINGTFSFVLPRSRKGAFTADIKMGEAGYELVNPFAEPLGGITFTGGHMESGEAHIRGNNFKIEGGVTLRYDDLHVVPIKKEQRTDDGDYKKHGVTGFIANVLLIKNANPGRFGGLRQPTISFERGETGNFFNFTWSAIKSGILKTIGVPQRLGM